MQKCLQARFYIHPKCKSTVSRIFLIPIDGYKNASIYAGQNAIRPAGGQPRPVFGVSVLMICLLCGMRLRAEQERLCKIAGQFAGRDAPAFPVPDNRALQQSLEHGCEVS
jgi:hypothetical protein